MNSPLPQPVTAKVTSAAASAGARAVATMPAPRHRDAGDMAAALVTAAAGAQRPGDHADAVAAVSSA